MGLETARRALEAQQIALQVTAHNIANANTPGYSRQVLAFSPTDPYTVPTLSRSVGAGQVGTGVSVSDIVRVRDAFLDSQARGVQTLVGEMESRRDALQEVEIIFNEPSESGLHSVVDAFWQSLQVLANNPESPSVRSAVKQAGETLALAFRTTHRQLQDLRANIDSVVRARVLEINDIAKEISQVNQQIANVAAVNDKPNDLLDRRDSLLEKLSRYADISILPENNGTVSVFLNGVALASPYGFQAISVANDPLNSNYAALTWSSTGTPVEVRGGELRGLIDTRDKAVADYVSKLNTAANTMITQINAVHQGGFGLPPANATGLDFFVGSSGLNNAGDIAVNPALTSNNIAAASAANSPGDGANALLLAAVKSTATPALGGASPDDYFRAIIGQVGLDTRETTRIAEGQALLAKQIANQRDSLSGVSLDEEMVNMMKYQHAYQAAAKLMTVVDEMLDTLINQLGRV
ncbi:MAG TPA: flagellar hook-associated protein FlgK [Bacillota bacterium]